MYKAPIFLFNYGTTCLFVTRAYGKFTKQIWVHPTTVYNMSILIRCCNFGFHNRLGVDIFFETTMKCLVFCTNSHFELILREHEYK